MTFLKVGHTRSRFLYFRLLYLNVQLVVKMLPILGFEPHISGARSDRSTNWVTTTTASLTWLVVWAKKIVIERTQLLCSNLWGGCGVEPRVAQTSKSSQIQSFDWHSRRSNRYEGVRTTMGRRTFGSADNRSTGNSALQCHPVERMN